MMSANAVVMSDDEQVHLATIEWDRGEWLHAKGKYSREHTWHLSGGGKLKASDSPFFLPAGYRDKTKLNAENLFVASISSAHMLTWLHIAFAMGIEVKTYRDEAHGVLSEIEEGVYWVSEVILHPRIVYDERSSATPAAEARIHELAQEQSFLARSIKTEVTVRSA